MIQCKPERNPRQVMLIMAVLVALAVAVGLLVSVSGSLRWAAQIVFVVLVALGIQVVYRYTMTEMIYAVGEGTFAVTRVVGRKKTVVCSLNLMTAEVLMPKAEFRQKQAEKKAKTALVRYNFCQNIRCTTSYIYLSEFNGKMLAVEFEPNAIFVRAMLDEIDNTKKNQGESGDGNGAEPSGAAL